MIKAKKAGFTYEEYTEMCFIINEYVLPEPIDEKELNTAIRQEEWDNLEIGEDKNTILIRADEVIQHWGCILGDDKFAFYDNDLERYSTNQDTIKYYLQQKYGYTEKNLTISRIEEVVDQVNLALRSLDKYKYTRSLEYVLCNKELVSTWKDEIKPNTRTIYTDVFYPFSIMSKEEMESFNGRAKTFIDEITCGNEDTRAILLECLGCMLAPDKPFGKIFIWYGEGNNGKSLLLKLMKVIMGNLMSHSNILNVNDKFSLAGMVGCICNVTDDVGITTLTETGLLKSIIDGSPIEVHRKFKDSVWWTPNSQFVMCCNEIPRIQDDSKGLIRRLGFIPFDMQIDDDHVDRTLYTKIISDENNLRYIMSEAIYAYRKAYQKGALTKTDKQKDLENDFIEENASPAKVYRDSKLEEFGEEEALTNWLDNKTTDEVYADYIKWCETSYSNPIPRKAFTAKFSKLLPANVTKKVLSLNGVKFNCYQKKITKKDGN